MSKRPWMPFYFGDYLKNTAHLSTAEHGAYFLLIAHYWEHGGLPQDEAIIQRITKMTNRQWARSRDVLRSFFGDQWSHHRINHEIAQSIEKSRVNSANAKRSHESRKANAANSQTQSQSQYSVSKEDTAQGAPDPVNEDPKAKLFRLGKTMLVSFGVAEKRTGGLIGQWLKVRPDPDGLLAAIQFARDQNVAEPVAYISAVVHSKDKTNGKQSPGEKLRAIAARLRERELGESAPDQADAFRSD